MHDEKSIYGWVMYVKGKGPQRKEFNIDYLV